MAFKFNPFTGNFDIVGSSSGGTSPDNFSYSQINLGDTKTIPVNQQMILHQNIEINGTLIIDGTLVII